MARTTDPAKLQEFPDNSMVATLITKFNALLDELTALYTKLDADAGVTDVNYRTTLEVSVSKIATHSG